MIYLTFYQEHLLRDKIKTNSLLLGAFLLFSFFFFLINLYPIDNTLLRDTSLIDNKHYFIILITLVSFIDISAYLTGKIIGRNKIPSLISPNKTFEGYIGSLLLTVLAFISVSNHYGFQWTPLDLIILPNCIVLQENKELQEIIFIIFLQNLCYKLSLKKGINPDKPRNLAKVVTVE